MNYPDTVKLYLASEQLLDPDQESRWLSTPNCGIYQKFNFSLNQFSKLAAELELTEGEAVSSFLRFLKFLRGGYISMPLPCSHLLQAFARPSPFCPAFPSALQTHGAALFNCYLDLRSLEEHPYEMAVAQIAGELPSGSLIRLVLPRRYSKKASTAIDKRLFEYSELSTHTLEFLSPQEAARAETVADVQIVLGNPDYLETPPFTNYRSFSCARASRIYSLCLAPHARKYCFDTVYRLFRGIGGSQFPDFQSWDFEVSKIPDGQYDDVTEDLVFPYLSSAVTGHESTGDTGDYEAITTFLQGPSGAVSLNSRHILIARISSTQEYSRILEVISTDIEEIEIGDVVVIQKSGLRDAELAELGKLDSEYQKNRKLVFGWKGRLTRADQTATPWTLNRLLIKGGQTMRGVNQGQLDRWKSPDHGCPGSDDTFRCLLGLLEYTADEIREIISAKYRLHNHHRQAGKNLSNLAPTFLKNRTIRGNIDHSILDFEISSPPGPVKFAMLKICDLTFDYNS